MTGADRRRPRRTRRWPRRTPSARIPVRRLVQLVLSCVVLGAGVACLLDAALGSDGYSTLDLGAEQDVWAAVRRRQRRCGGPPHRRGLEPWHSSGIGTVVQMVVVGGTVNVLLPLLPTPDCAGPAVRRARGRVRPAVAGRGRLPRLAHRCRPCGGGRDLVRPAAALQVELHRAAGGQCGGRLGPRGGRRAGHPAGRRVFVGPTRGPAHPGLCSTAARSSEAVRGDGNSPRGGRRTLGGRPVTSGRTRAPRHTGRPAGCAPGTRTTGRQGSLRDHRTRGPPHCCASRRATPRRRSSASPSGSAPPPRWARSTPSCTRW